MITFFTIVLDGMPWITLHPGVFEQLKMPWRWIIVEGVAENVACTSWCNRLEPRLSSDGTTEALDCMVGKSENITVIRKPMWPGKVAMCNAALEQIFEPCLLWQVDADELWTERKISAVSNLFAQYPYANCAYFWCRYFVGSDIVVDGRDSWSNNPAYEWKRVWRFKPGMRFKTHEPPVIEGMVEHPLWHYETEQAGAVFDHLAYAWRKQVEFKQTYYAGAKNPVGSKYSNIVQGWERLQANEQWPAKLNQFMPFVPDDVMVKRLQ